MIKNLICASLLNAPLHKGPLIEGSFSRIRDHRGHTDSQGPCKDLSHKLNFLNKRSLY